MIILTKLIGLLIVIMGLLSLVNTELLKKLVEYFKEGNRLYVSMVIKALIGLILFVSASTARMPSIIYVIGLLYILGPVVGLILGVEKMKKLLDWWAGQTEKVYKSWAIGAMVFGCVIIFAA